MSNKYHQLNVHLGSQEEGQRLLAVLDKAAALAGKKRNTFVVEWIKSLQEKTMDIAKENGAINFKSEDWRHAVAELAPDEAVEMLDDALRLHVAKVAPDLTPSKQAEQVRLAHNGFLTLAFMEYENPAYRKFIDYHA